jgi:DNA-nicking Smr family endonuclease
VKKGRNSGGIDAEGKKLWQKVASSVKAYSAPKNPPAAGLVKGARKSPPLPETAPRSFFAAPEEPKGFDRSTEKKLQRGQLPLEGRLDMHGMMQDEAFRALRRFILTAVAQGKRTVLVITGKGRNSEGVLKRMLPFWLEDPDMKKHIIALTPARPKDGGGGAFYLRLRKVKSA